MNRVVSLREVTVTAKLGSTSVDVLRRVSLELDQGEVLGIVGESGAGKSLLGRLIARHLPPGFEVTSGALEFQGKDLLAQSKRETRQLLGRKIAYIPQDAGAALDPVRTIGWQFGRHLARLGIERPARRAHMVRALEEVGLHYPSAALDRYAHQLSGGECQRVLIAMAFSSGPALLIADEPTTALDVTTQSTIVALLRRMQAAHKTSVIFVTHDLRLARQICDKVMVLYAGDPVERGSAVSLFATPSHPYTRALLAANPSVTGPRVKLAPLPGTMPGLKSLARLSGCRFASRCAVADAACRIAPPAWRAVGPNHAVTCSPGCTAGSGPVVARKLPDARVTSSAPILRVENLGKIFTAAFGRQPTVALEPLSFTVAPGEIIGIVGESGSGKSTLARLLVGLEAPSSGTIRIDDVDVSTHPHRTGELRRNAMQMVFQDPQSALNPRRTVADLVTQAMEVQPPTADRASRVAQLLATIGLPLELGARFPFQLSGGQRQRVNIARALCRAPRILIADEIVSGLDVSVQAQLLNLLLKLRDSSKLAVVLISHDLSVVRYLCDRVMVLHRGRVVESGTVRGVFEQPQSDYTRALLSACPPDAPLDALTEKQPGEPEWI